MNDDELETKLRALTARLARPDPTPGWKASILAQAAQARDQNAPRTPRWLIASLGATWVVIALLRLTTPDTGGTKSDDGASPSLSATNRSSDAPDTPWSTIIALNTYPESLNRP